jgi:Na+/proline symporter
MIARNAAAGTALASGTSSLTMLGSSTSADRRSWATLLAIALAAEAALLWVVTGLRIRRRRLSARREFAGPAPTRGSR